MKSRIQQWGIHLALRTPGKAAKIAELVRGSEGEIQTKKGRFELQSKVRKHHTLAELLKNVRKSHLHREVDFGPPVGKEVW